MTVRISDTQLRSIIEREETGLKGWDGGPLAPRVYAMALDLCDARAMLALFPKALRTVTEVMERGKRTHSGDWRDFAANFHLARARRHLYLLAIGDANEPHLAHAVCRLLMELERANSNNEGMVR
jgi:Domain of unknown function (DUF5664)